MCSTNVPGQEHTPRTTTGQAAARRRNNHVLFLEWGVAPPVSIVQPTDHPSPMWRQPSRYYRFTGIYTIDPVDSPFKFSSVRLRSGVTTPLGIKHGAAAHAPRTSKPGRLDRPIPIANQHHPNMPLTAPQRPGEPPSAPNRHHPAAAGSSAACSPY